MKIINNFQYKMNISHLNRKIKPIMKEGKYFIIILMKHFNMSIQLIKIKCLDLIIQIKIKKLNQICFNKKKQISKKMKNYKIKSKNIKMILLFKMKSIRKKIIIDCIKKKIK
jgi:hypothetical protein